MHVSFPKITKMPLKPNSSDPKSAETFVKKLNIKDKKCNHGLPFYACMPCSH
jgi:hypothetical protein